MANGKFTLSVADLSTIELFRGLPPNILDELIARSSGSRFAKGATAVTQSTRSGEIHAIVSGAFKAWSLTKSGDAVTLAVMGKGEVFGEMAFLDGEKHSANVTALTTSSTLRIDASVLESVVQAYPSVRDYLGKLLAARLRRLSRASERMAVEDVSARLARSLLELSDRFGVPELSGTRILLDLSQQDLAELVGATRERVNRVLAGWMKQGFISRRGRQVVLLSPRQLSSRAGINNA